jgi:hypothetical protein
MTAAFTVSNTDDKIKLRVLLDRYRIKEYKETPLIDKFEEITQIIGRQYQDDTFKATMLLIYDVLMRKE